MRFRDVFFFFLVLIYFSYAFASSSSPSGSNVLREVFRATAPLVGVSVLLLISQLNLSGFFFNSFFSSILSLTAVCNYTPSQQLINWAFTVSYIASIGVFFFYLFLSFVERFLTGKTRISLVAKAENVVVTILLIILFQLLFNLVGGTNYYFLDQSIDYTNKGIAVLVNAYIKMLFSNIFLANFFNLDIPFPPKKGQFGVMSINLGFVMKPLSESLSVLSNAVSLSLTEWVVRRITYCIIPFFVLNYLLPLGALFRSLEFTKGAGSAMLGLAFSLYFFYPLMGFLSYLVFDIYSAILSPSSVSYSVSMLEDFLKGSLSVMTVLVIVVSVSALLSSVVGGLSVGTESLLARIPIIGGFVGRTVRRLIDLISNLLAIAASPVYYLTFIVFVMTMIFFVNVIIDIIRFVFEFFVMFSLVLPAISIYLTIVFAMELSERFGMSIDLTPFMRLI